MNFTPGVIMLIHRAQNDADNLKELIEFMDEPEVCTASPRDWRESVGDRRLGAVFVGADLSESEVQTVLGGLGEMDPNVPIVMLSDA